MLSCSHPDTCVCDPALPWKNQEMLARADRDGVAAVRWHTSPQGHLEGWARGPVEAASHVETTLTQAVQELVVAAQLRRWRREGLATPSPDTLLASALARLAGGVAGVCRGVPPGTPLLLFAGRRASSRRFLALQNWYCAVRLCGWAGTSALLATAVLDGLTADGRTLPGGVRYGPLVGTLAHEVIMACSQMLHKFDVLEPEPGNDGVAGLTGGADGVAGLAGGTDGIDGASPQDTAAEPATPPGLQHGERLAQVTALAAHLFLAAAGGGFAGFTALADTQGTRGFVRAALAARLPRGFAEDMAAAYPEDWARGPVARAPHPAGPRVFDVFPVWRLDSGDYEQMASRARGEGGGLFI